MRDDIPPQFIISLSLSAYVFVAIIRTTPGKRGHIL